MKILVVQLLPRQYRQLLNRYKGEHEIVNYKSTKTMDTGVIKRKAESADKVIIMTRFVSHKALDVIPREKTIFVNGCMSDLLRQLDEL